MECDEDADRQEQAGGKVRNGSAGSDRTLTRQPGHAHQSAKTLSDLVDSASVTVRAVLAEPRDRPVYDSRVDRAERFIVDAEAELHRRPHVFNDNVSGPHKLMHDLESARGLEIKQDRAFVAVEILEV